MGVAGDDAKRVRFAGAGGTYGTVIVGRPGRGYQTVYARREGADEVYLVSGSLGTVVERAVREWRDKRIVAVDTAAIHTVLVDHEGGGFSVVKGDSVWTFGDGGAIDPNGIRDVFAELRDFRAVGFLTESDSVASLEQGASVVVLDEAGDTLAALTLGSGSGDRWVRAAGDPVIYSVNSFRADRVAPSRERMAGS